MARRTPTIPRIDLPSTLDPPEIRKLAGQYRDLHERHRLAEQEAVEAEHALDRAKQADTQAAADAIRNGKADPGEKATTKAEQAVEGKRREVEALEVAGRDAHAELLAAVDRHRPTWSVKVEQRIEERRSAVRDAIDALERAQRELREDQALAHWLDRFPDARFKTAPGLVYALLGANREPLHLSAVIAALRETIDPPERPEAPNVQPLRHIEHAL